MIAAITHQRTLHELRQAGRDVRYVVYRSLQGQLTRKVVELVGIVEGSRQEPQADWRGVEGIRRVNVLMVSMTQHFGITTVINGQVREEGRSRGICRVRQQQFVFLCRLVQTNECKSVDGVSSVGGGIDIIATSAKRCCTVAVGIELDVVGVSVFRQQSPYVITDPQLFCRYIVYRRCKIVFLVVGKILLIGWRGVFLQLDIVTVSTVDAGAGEGIGVKGVFHIDVSLTIESREGGAGCRTGCQSVDFARQGIIIETRQVVVLEVLVQDTEGPQMAGQIGRI